jgi:hypothetical protein
VCFAGIRFPRGDAGPQMFGRGTTKFSGDEWNKSQRPRQAIEVGSNQKDVVRSWKAPGCEHIIYRASHHATRALHCSGISSMLAAHTPTCHPRAYADVVRAC